MKPYALQDTVKKIVKYAIENIHDTYIWQRIYTQDR